MLQDSVENAPEFRPRRGVAPCGPVSVPRCSDHWPWAHKPASPEVTARCARLWFLLSQLSAYSSFLNWSRIALLIPKAAGRLLTSCQRLGGVRYGHAPEIQRPTNAPQWTIDLARRL